MANTVYENKVLENKIEDILLTTVDMNNYLTPDYSLTESAGMIKQINTYTATGDVEDLAQGEGNTTQIEASFTSKSYTVETTQGRFIYFDEEFLTDPIVVDTGIDGLTKTMTNDFTKKAIEAMNGATLSKNMTAWDYNNVVDAIAAYPYEDESGLFILINPAQKAEFRKNLQDDLKYVEANARTGYIGTVCGVPVIVSKAVPENTGFLATKAAVKAFIKKGVEIEQERDPNTRKNTVYARKVMVIALADATRCIKLVGSTGL